MIRIRRTPRSALRGRRTRRRPPVHPSGWGGVLETGRGLQMCRVRRYRGSWPDPRRVTSVSATTATPGKTTDALGRAVDEDRRAGAPYPSVLSFCSHRWPVRGGSPFVAAVRARPPLERSRAPRAEPARGCGRRGVRARTCAPPRTRIGAPSVGLVVPAGQLVGRRVQRRQRLAARAAAHGRDGDGPASGHEPLHAARFAHESPIHPARILRGAGVDIRNPPNVCVRGTYRPRARDRADDGWAGPVQHPCREDADGCPAS